MNNFERILIFVHDFCILNNNTDFKNKITRCQFAFLLLLQQKKR